MARPSSLSKAELVRQVTTRLDAIYVTFEPAYQVDISGIKLEQLPPWTSGKQDEQGAASYMQPYRLQPAGPLEK